MGEFTSARNLLELALIAEANARGVWHRATREHAARESDRRDQLILLDNRVKVAAQRRQEAYTAKVEAERYSVQCQANYIAQLTADFDTEEVKDG